MNGLRRFLMRLLPLAACGVFLIGAEGWTQPAAPAAVSDTHPLPARASAPATLPGLPAYDLAAPPWIRVWQSRILRDWYLLHRPALSATMAP